MTHAEELRSIVLDMEKARAQVPALFRYQADAIINPLLTRLEALATAMEGEANGN